MEDAAEHAVAQPGDALAQILHGQTEGKEAWAFDLQAVVEKGHADGGAPLAIIRVLSVPAKRPTWIQASGK